jgi:acetolactate synthase I/II/III large subunit
MDLELGDHYYVKFTNPDVISYAQSAAPKILLRR